MSFCGIFTRQPIRLGGVFKQQIEQIGCCYKRFYSSANKQSIFSFSKRSNIKIDNRIKLTSMMGLVTISDSIKDALYKSEVIPTVVHDDKFTPKGFLMIQYKNSDKEVTMGNTLKVEDTQEKPIVHFTLNLPDGDGESDKTLVGKDDLFTLVLTDPDAPTKGDEKWSEYCHYIEKDIKLNEVGPEVDGVETFAEKLTTADLKGAEIVPYMGPGPPAKTGLHRYVFLLYKQGSRGVEAPSDRPCWGTGVAGYGAAEYAAKYGLELYAVNFFYAKNEVQ